jgi:hypothetical protein
MAKAKRARTAETPKQPSLRLTLRAPYLYPDRAYSASRGPMSTGRLTAAEARAHSPLAESMAAR